MSRRLPNHLEISILKKLKHKFKTGCRVLCTPFEPFVPDVIKNHFPLFGKVSLTGSHHPKIQFYTHGHYGTDRIALKLARYGLAGYEVETTRVLMALVKRAKTMIDVGANTGCYALLAALVNPHCQVIAFEPVPFIYEMLVNNIKLNHLHNLTAQEFALSDSAGFAPFYVTRTKVGIPTDSSLQQGFRDQIEELRLNTTTLDDFVIKHKITSLDLLKIDVESAEEKVIRGALQTIQQYSPFIICEVLDHVDHSYIQQTLKQFHYQFYHLTLDGLKHHTHLLGSQNINGRNYLFVPQHRNTELFELCAQSNIKIMI